MSDTNLAYSITEQEHYFTSVILCNDSARTINEKVIDKYQQIKNLARKFARQIFNKQYCERCSPSDMPRKGARGGFFIKADEGNSISRLGGFGAVMQQVPLHAVAAAGSASAARDRAGSSVHLTSKLRPQPALPMTRLAQPETEHSAAPPPLIAPYTFGGHLPFSHLHGLIADLQQLLPPTMKEERATSEDACSISSSSTSSSTASATSFSSPAFFHPLPSLAPTPSPAPADDSEKVDFVALRHALVKYGDGGK